MRIILRLVAIALACLLVGAATAARPTIPSCPPVEEGFGCEIVRNGSSIGYLFTPEAPAPYPAVIVVGGSEGGVETARKAGPEFVTAGFAVLGMPYFGIPGLPENLERIPLEYFLRGVDLLERRPDVDPNRIGIMGGSKGGELALLLGSVEPRIRAVAAWVPSGVVWQSQRKLGRNTSSWTYHGEDVPFVRYRSGFVPGVPVVDLFEQELSQSESLSAATIAVERIHGPILLMSATKDEIWPSTILSQMVMARLAKSDFEYRFEHVAYNDSHTVAKSATDMVRRIKCFFRARFALQ